MSSKIYISLDNFSFVLYITIVICSAYATNYIVCKHFEKGVIVMMIRTINAAYDEIKSRDPETAISRELVRQMVKTGMVPSLSVGNKKLVDVDVLEEYVARITGSCTEDLSQ